MNLEQENALLKRQLAAATTALDRIKDREYAVHYAEPAEVAREALEHLRRLSKEKDTPVTWGVKFEQVTENGWKAEFFVEQQGFTLFEDQENEDGEQARFHARWFWDMFRHALARLGVDVTTAKELIEHG